MSAEAFVTQRAVVALNASVRYQVALQTVSLAKLQGADGTLVYALGSHDAVCTHVGFHVVWQQKTTHQELSHILFTKYSTTSVTLNTNMLWKLLR